MLKFLYTTKPHQFLYSFQRIYHTSKPHVSDYKSSEESNPFRLKRPIELKVDTSKLIQKTYSKEVPSPLKEPETGLTAVLKNRIKSGGPLSIAAFMQEALWNHQFGYYYTAKKKHETHDLVFGKEGDFITSPELSPLFSEMIAIWCINQWEQLGSPNLVRLVELGPGRGTLMYDLLRTCKRFSQFWSSLTGIHLIEGSPTLQEIQQKKLQEFETKKPILWHDRITEVPEDFPIIVIAHEFFDALPVYLFQFTERGWCEILVDIDEEGERHFRFVLAPAETGPSKVFAEMAGVERQFGNTAEISPHGMAITQQLALKIAKHGGSALIIDYGDETIQGPTLQGIKNHQFVHVLSTPGEVDLSTYVNFGLLRHSVKKSGAPVKCFGPQMQCNFLYELGIDARLIKLLQNPRLTDEQVDNLTKVYTRLTDENDMGSVFKAFCISSMPQPPDGFVDIP